MRGSTVWDVGDRSGASSDVYGPYIDAPVWPWSVAGWSVAVLCVLLALVAWLSA